MKTKIFTFKTQLLPLLLASGLGLISFLGLVQADAGGGQAYAGQNTSLITSAGSVSDAPLSNMLITPSSATGAPGELIQVVAAVRREGSTVKENVTSCFSCPTPDNHSNGTVSYKIVRGPASMQWSKVKIHDDAEDGDEIILQGSYYDNISNTSVVSHYNKITVRGLAVRINELQEGEGDNLPETAEETADNLKPSAEEFPDHQMSASEGNEGLILTNSSDEGDELAEPSSESTKKPEGNLLPAHEMNTATETISEAKGAEKHKSVSESGNPVVYWTIGILALLALAAVIAKRRMAKIDQIAPEHRAKENELYEAFGEKHHTHSIPANHREKEKEVEAAFGGSDAC